MASKTLVCIPGTDFAYEGPGCSSEIWIKPLKEKERDFI